MERIRLQFERDLRTKLQQRCSSHMSEETFLLKCFRFFDPEDSKTVSRQEWRKALERIGIAVEDSLFDLYDADSSGDLEYEEFCAAVFGAESGVRKRLTPLKGENFSGRQRAEEVLNVIRGRLVARGIRGLLGLARQFRALDEDCSGVLEFDEFVAAVRNYRVTLQKEEAELLFQYVDQDGSGGIDYGEFLSAVRGPLGPFRRELVAEAFSKLDPANSGSVDLGTIRAFYNASGHPELRSGKRTEDEVLNEFLDTFETHHSLQGHERVSYEEFEEYYCTVSAGIENDQFFEDLILNVWGTMRDTEKQQLGSEKTTGHNALWLADHHRSQFGGSVASTAPFGTSDEPVNYSTVLRPNRQPQEDLLGLVNSTPAAGCCSWAEPKVCSLYEESSAEEVVREFKEKVAARGVRGFIGLARQFRIMDDNDTKSLAFAEFFKGVRDFRVDISDEDIECLFLYFDVEHIGAIDYEEFLRRVQGPLSESRKQIVTEAFRRLEQRGSECVTLEFIKSVFHADAHPDVRMGKKSPDEIICEFLDTFETHHRLYRGAHSVYVSLSEFEEYYSHISAVITDDRYFELMLRNAWDCENKDYERSWRVITNEF